MSCMRLGVTYKTESVNMALIAKDQIVKETNMATRRKTYDDPDTERNADTVLGGDTAEWELVEAFTTFDKRRCTNCGKTGTFPKDMSKCVWTSCPECGKEMRW